jgi:excisionase family DNA binding protein
LPGGFPSPRAPAHADRLAYSVPEAARALGLYRDVIYNEIRAGRLESLKVGRRRIITRTHIEEFLMRLGQL